MDDEDARSLIESGFGKRPSDLTKALRQSPAEGDERLQLLHAIFGKDGAGLLHGKTIDDYQAERPDIYVKKRRLRPRLSKVPLTLVIENGAFQPPEAPRYITTNEFVELYSAVAFANRCGIILNCHLTILWRALGLENHDQIAWELSDFTKRFQSWCSYRKFPAVWIYSHENSPSVGLHTHVLLHIHRRHADEFRMYVQETANRISRNKADIDVGKPVSVSIRKPRTNNLEARRKSMISVQWLWFQYLCKGVRPRSKIFRHKKTHNEFVQIYTDDLIRFHPQSPGPVLCKKRVGSSQNLECNQRRTGYINAAIKSREPNFKSLLEMNRHDVRLMYSDYYYRRFLDQARALYRLDGIDLDAALQAQVTCSPACVRSELESSGFMLRG